MRSSDTFHRAPISCFSDSASFDLDPLENMSVPQMQTGPRRQGSSRYKAPVPVAHQVDFPLLLSLPRVPPEDLTRRKHVPLRRVMMPQDCKSASRR